MAFSKTHKKNNPLWSLLWFFTALFFIAGCTADDPPNVPDKSILETSITGEEVVSLINEAFPTILKRLKLNYEHIGFYSEAELEQIQVGKPYLYILLTKDFLTDSVYDYFGKYVHVTNTWYVPLMIGDEIRCFATALTKNDTLMYPPGLGASVLAERFNACEHKYGIPENRNRYYLHSPGTGLFESIMIDSLDNFVIYPTSDIYEVQNSFEEFFYSFKE